MIGPAAGLTAEQLAFMGGVIDALPAGGVNGCADRGAANGGR